MAIDQQRKDKEKQGLGEHEDLESGKVPGPQGGSREGGQMGSQGGNIQGRQGGQLGGQSPKSPSDVGKKFEGGDLGGKKVGAEAEEENE